MLAVGVHMGVSTGCPITVGEVMKRVDNKGWVYAPSLLRSSVVPVTHAPLCSAFRRHIGAALAMLVGAVDSLFDNVRTHIPAKPKL